MEETKCLICDEYIPQQGLELFKFPKEESRLKMWIKAVTPMLDILKILPASLMERAGICTKHFAQGDYNNLKKNSELQDTCTLLDSNRELLQTDDIYAVDSGINEELDITNIYETDTFKCGRCKTQFQDLSAFINHKKTPCDFKIMTDNKTDNGTDERIFFPDIISTNEDKLSPTNEEALRAMDGSENLVELMHEPIPSGVLSVFVGTNQVFFTNPLESIELTNQFLLNSDIRENKSDLIFTADSTEGINVKELPENLILPRPLVEDKNVNNSVTLTSEVTDNASLVNFEPQQSSNEIYNTENVDINVQGDIIFEFRYENDNPTKTDKTDKGKMKLPCSYCGKLFDKPFNLQQHERVHTGERPFQCVICGRAFSQKANVRKHMIRHKVWPQAKQTLKLNTDVNRKNKSEKDALDRTSYSCQYCSLSFSSYSLHKKHLVVHSNFKVYRCIQKGCDETFSDLDDFLSHSESHSSAEFQCHVCLKIFTSLEELGAHQYDHDLPNKGGFNVKLKCEICHAQFKSAESLKNHMAVDTHNYECPDCKSVFSCERFLRRHLATHSDPSQSKFECEFCKKTFRTQKYLNNHVFIHSAEKPFNCELCCKQFASKYRLKRHLSIHQSQYLECPFKMYLGCDKKFYRKDKLRNHVTTHCHIKIRSCQTCSKTFTSFAKLQQHTRREHAGAKKRQMLKCINCSQMFRKQKQLQQHHCTVDEKKFKSRIRNDVQSKKADHMNSVKEFDNSEMVSNIEIIMVPYLSNT